MKSTFKSPTTQEDESQKARMARIIGLFTIIDIFLIDQVSKWFVYERIMLPFYREMPVPKFHFEDIINWFMGPVEKLPPLSLNITPFLNVVMVWNEGISFGMVQSDSQTMTWALTGVALAIIFGFLIWLLKTTSVIQGIAISMVIGGALGNVMDRMRFGAVIDFIDVHVAGMHWPAFNVADAAICVGMIILIIHSFVSDKKTSKQIKS